jgi:hypothetical protein
MLVGRWCFYGLWLSGLWHLLFFVTIVPEKVLIHYRKISSPPPERWKYSIRLHRVIIQETTILDLYRCDSLNCHIGNWWCLQEADWNVGLVHPMGIATVGTPSTIRIPTCGTVKITALHIHMVSPQPPSAWSRKKHVSTVFCSTVLQRRNYKGVGGV